MSITRYVNPEMKRRIMRGDTPQWILNHIRADYLIKAYLSAPFWVDKNALYRLRDEARRKTRETGIKHVLDHEIPLTHELVSGLTVPANLRVVPYSVNAHKGNKWNPFQMELAI